MASSSRRVVITGLGAISPFGNTVESLWDGLLAGRSAVGPLQSFPTKGLPTAFAAEARQFTGSIDDFGPLENEKRKAIRKALKVMCRESQMGVAAAQRALADAGLTSGTFDPDAAGVLFGSDYMMTVANDFTSGILQCIGEQGKFEFSRWAAEGMGKLEPLWLLKYLPNMPASHVAIYNDMRGPNNSITLREASANLAIGEAFRTIMRGSAELIVAGATGTRVHPTKYIHAVTQEEVAGNGAEPSRASRPFDLARSGMVLGEGAGALVLEELGFARSRGAKIYAEVIGFGSSSAIDRQGIAQRGVAMANALRATLRDAGVKPDQVGHIHAHGLSTRTCDAEEARALAEVLGPACRHMPVTAAKSYFGNLGAGSGAIELIASALALKHGRLFPVLNYETPDPECPLAVVTSADTPPGNNCISLSVTPQGQASAVMIRAFA